MHTKTKLVEQHYDNNTQDEWERLERHRTEFAVSLRTIADHLPPAPRRLIDIGGGPGRYAIALSHWGYRVTLVDLSAGNLAMARRQATAAGVTLDGTFQANALDLTQFEAGVYDAALLMGPLYHLLHLAERRRALVQAVRLLKPGGLIFVAFVTRFAPFRYAVREDPEWLARQPAYAQRILESGVHDQGQGFPQAYFTHPEEIPPLIEQAGLRTLATVGCEGIASGNEEAINALQGEAWNAWVAFNYQMGQEPTLHGASEHLLVVAQLPHP